MPTSLRPKNETPYLGYHIYGAKPFSIKSTPQALTCETSGDATAMSVGIGFIFGPMMIILFALQPQYWTSLPFLMKGVLVFFVCVAFYLIYSGLFKKRKLVFNGTNLSIEFYENKKLLSTLPKDQIQSFEITTEPRSRTTQKSGTIQWTAHIYNVRSNNGERKPLLESQKEGPINEVGELVRLLFKLG